MPRLLSVGFLTIFLISCGSDGSSLEFSQVVGIPPGDGAGAALSGTFAIVQTITSNSCTETDLKTEDEGNVNSFDVLAVQNDGEFQINKIDVSLDGSISFENAFDVGGADIVDRGQGTQNILRLAHVTGDFQNADALKGTGEVRLTGDLDGKIIDCWFTFNFTGVRK